MKREIDLTPYIPAIMAEAEKASERDYLMLALVGEGKGFRRGEVTGNKDRREVWPVDMFERAKKKAEIPRRKAILAKLFDGHSQVIEEDGTYSLIRDGQCVLKMRKQDPLPGLRIEDFHDGAIWVKGKGQTQFQEPLPKWLYERVKRYIGDREQGKIFDFSADGLYKICHKYAKAAGVPDWKLAHPHRFRHAFIRAYYKKTKDPVMTQRAGRHKDFNMTRKYIGEVDIDEYRQSIELTLGRKS